MKIFAGAPIHLMEFENANVNLNITSHSWSFLGQSGVSVILNKDHVNIFNGLSEEDLISFETRLINLNDEYKILFLLQHESFKFENYFYAKMRNADLIVLRIDLLNKSSYTYLLNVIISNMFLVKIPILLFKIFKETHEISYFFPDANDYTVFKDSPYAYIEIKKRRENIIMLHGYYRNMLHNKLSFFLKKVGDLNEKYY
ncbi:hypothetical protein SAMN02745164_00443 [Marinitoga hydrogenitolerans DSM 16785]|uniref:Uncharacterized protein n=1 Tax=Marinitoga hydrogenitolerans (strain DSM 16785 / JCM 12826 / AT1271) TaxID=1122195 RepID=A0A1M4THS8_MARH1|nr:hypothetical protein [Marinitoga hydrogenitolerans]SHE44020.1 hypothetical protein SAMN02745164_00443 [Marinitoga hydrogenitolerans DSM 16785]